MIRYHIAPLDPNAHLFQVRLSIAEPAAQQRLSLPVWIPGSYLVREFARNLQNLSATQGGRAVALRQLDKASWQADCEGREPLELSWEVYAFDNSVRTAFLDASRGFFNGTGVFLRVEGREHEPHEVEIGGLPQGWEVATALPASKVDAAGAGLYRAAGYDELVDHPVELGTFWRGRFTACGVPHEFVVAGAPPTFDGERLLRDTQKICEAQIRFWNGGDRPHFERYVFMLNAVDDGYGGLEHRASTALICARRELPRQGDASLADGYLTLLGLISHEYFHTWNVKRLRPAEFARYDYTQENYTELLWFFEGFTSYYDDLFLVRAGLIDEARYLKQLAKAVNNTLAMPGRQLQSVAQASFDAWIRYYRQDENTLNSTVSYYAKGSLVALAFDLTLRREGRGTLDDVMHLLWQRSEGGPVDEADIAAALEHVGGRSYAKELAEWVHGTGELPLRELLRPLAVEWQAEPATVAQRLGVRATEALGVKLKSVQRGSAAERTGLAAGDELLAVNDWRLRKLDEIPQYVPTGTPLQWLVSRDQRVLRLEGAPLADAEGAVALRPAAEADAGAQALRRAWLRP